MLKADEICMDDFDNASLMDTGVPQLVDNTSKSELEVHKKDECWEVEETIFHDNCPFKSDIKVIFKELDYEKILALNSKYPDTEFSVYFNVVKEEEGKFLVTEIIIPKQEVSVASVEFTEHIRSDGVLHKHPNGICNFSGTDEKYINANHDISLLFVNGAFQTGTARIVTPCKCKMKVGVEVLVRKPANSEIDAFIKQAEEKIVTNKGIKKNGGTSLQNFEEGFVKCTS